MHPLATRRAVTFLCGFVHIGTVAFWLFYASHDPFRRFFVPSRGVPLGVMLAVAAATLVFLCVWPLRIAIHSMRYGRIRVATSLQTVLAWSVVGLVLLVIPLVSRAGSGWLATIGATLLVAARLLWVQVRRAVLFDG